MITGLNSLRFVNDVYKCSIIDNFQTLLHVLVRKRWFKTIENNNKNDKQNMKDRSASCLLWILYSSLNDITIVSEGFIFILVTYGVRVGYDLYLATPYVNDHIKIVALYDCQWVLRSTDPYFLY